VTDENEDEITGRDVSDSPRARAPKGQAKSHWHRNRHILKRMAAVEKLRDDRLSNVAIARKLGLPVTTVWEDIERLRTVWENQLGEEMPRQRGEKVHELEDVARLARAALHEDQVNMNAVVYGTPAIVTCVGVGIEHGRFEGCDPGVTYGETWTCIAPHRVRKRVYRDDKGSAHYTSNKAALLQVVRQCSMDAAKIMGLVVDKQAATTGDGVDLKTTLAALLTSELDDEQFTAQSVRRKPFVPSLPEPDPADTDDDDWEVWTP
jgi:hypothetical protein